MKMAFGRIVVGGILAVWGLTFYLLTMTFDSPLNAYDSGPAAFPKIMAGGLFILAVWMVIAEFRRIGLPEKIKAKRTGPIAATALILILYVFCIPYLGYYVSTLVFIPLVLASAGVHDWKYMAVVTFSILLFNYFAFDRLLGVPLPKFLAGFPN